MAQVGFGVAPKQSLPSARILSGGIAPEKFAIAEPARQHARRVRYPGYNHCM